jgi:hypothetical protein
MKRLLLLCLFALLASPAAALSPIVPNIANYSPASTVYCRTADYDIGDSQQGVQICTQVWYNADSQCYYDAVIDRTGTPWRVVAMELRLMQYGQNPFCNVEPLP